ncbi:hypothetical protein WQ54_31265 [Bacillus sp. SA1-12]|uniref:DUF4097 family beta strand repeat-containing protein n=1 Tax=Bacillus sp. SA1-12 TaxID=1455638 RepID=UPI00062710E2|nr:DUF4097 domain-containing protein [Bacillus sp. SA1-12]KKI88494.1 hypothetical protein WQ54_31265 [Bacillus sp. SA1-12]
MKEQKIRILKLVEQGKLSPDEALSLIEALDSDEQKKEKKITALSTDVIDFTNQNQAGHTSEKQASLGAKLMDWVDTAVKKVKELDLDLNFGKSIDIQHVFQLNDSAIHSLDIQLPNGSVNLQPWNERGIRVECTAKMYRAENIEQAREAFLSEVECYVEGNRFILHSDKKTMKMSTIVYVPEQAYEQIKIKLFNGPIRGENLRVNTIKAKTANGMLSFSALNGKKGEFETANGQIKLSSSRYEKLEVESITGLVQFNGSADKVDAQSFNGNLQLTLDHACEALYAKTTTGNIEVNVPEESKVIGVLKSNLGSLSAQLKDVDISFEKNETIQKELKFRTSPETTFSLFADSKTGSILIKNS